MFPGAISLLQVRIPLPEPWPLTLVLIYGGEAWKWSYFYLWTQWQSAPHGEGMCRAAQIVRDVSAPLSALVHSTRGMGTLMPVLVPGFASLMSPAKVRYLGLRLCSCGSGHCSEIPTMMVPWLLSGLTWKASSCLHREIILVCGHRKSLWHDGLACFFCM